MVTVEVILDGATEPAGAAPTSLERAATPALDALVGSGELSWRRTIPRGLPAGTETALPVLLGWTPRGPVARGALEAAARGIDVPPGSRVHRIDDLGAVGRAALLDAGFVLHDLGHDRRAASGSPLQEPGRDRVLAVGTGALPQLDPPARIWPDGVVPPRVLDHRTVVVAAIGAAAGAARLLGARVVVPAGATGDTDTDLRAKTGAALAALEAGAARIVVHVGGPDAAGHRRDAEAKVCAIEAADRHVIGPLRDAVAGRPGTTLAVGADHGCDPATGRHDGAPVPWVRWSA